MSRIFSLKLNKKAGSSSDSRTQFELAIVTGHNAMAECETNASALADVFGGKKRFKNTLLNVTWYARSVVTYFNDRLAVPNKTPHEYLARTPLGLNGMAGIDDQVGKHLRQLIEITEDHRCVLGKLCAHARPVCLETVARHFQGRGHDVVNETQLNFCGALAGHGQKRLHDFGGSFR